MSEKKKKYKVVIADDHILVRKALIRLVNSFDEYSVAYDVSGGNELKEKMSKSVLPDVVMMDVNMPNGNGIDAAGWMHKTYPQIKVLALSMQGDEETIIRMLKAGAKGYILKTMEPEELKVSLDSVLKNDFYLPEIISGKLIRGLQNYAGIDEREVLLTEKEKTFLGYLATELSNKEIAAKMFVSPRTIDDYRLNLCEKFNVRTRIGLVLYGIKKGLIEI